MPHESVRAAGDNRAVLRQDREVTAQVQQARSHHENSRHLHHERDASRFRLGGRQPSQQHRQDGCRQSHYHCA
jgi:hypothetical protein